MAKILFMRLSHLAAAMLFGALCNAQEEPLVLPPIELDAAELDAWVDWMQPQDGELPWSDVQWIPVFGQGVLQASEERKPVLFWAMNGHPLGCT